MKLEVQKIPRQEVSVGEEMGEIIIRIDGLIACRFVPTDPTGFIMRVGEFQSFSNEEQTIVIKDTFIVGDEEAEEK